MSDLQKALEAAVREAKAPGAVALVGRGDEVLFRGAAGQRTLLPKRQPAELDTLYDVASLTKMVCTFSVLMQLRDEGKLTLDQSPAEFVPLDWGKQVTIRQIVTHTAGLPPLLAGMKDIVHSLPEAVAQIAKVSLQAPPGTRRAYSDLGFIVLAQIIELIEHDTFDVICARRIFQPLGMTHSGFRPPDAWKKNCAATENCPWRGKVMLGEVHDENAWAIGGVSGHAGLFSTAEDLGRFCAGLLAGKVLRKETLDEVASLKHVPFYPWQALGWKIDPWEGGSEGWLAARNAIGHTGWTGTSMWIDRDSGLYTVLLSNTCHPAREARDNKTLRHVFHQAVNAEYFPRRFTVHTGLDRILWDNFEAIQGKRVALLTHLAATDQLERDPTAVLALRTDIPLRRIFTPEHGLRGNAEAGALVKGQEGGVETISLYGEQKAPTTQQLADIDLFVVNLQDIGARYYTYIATMKACLEACARAGTPVLVLDRPNPLGNEIIEGPLPDTTDSLVCAAHVPIRHGMTLGEMAMFLQQTEPSLKTAKITAYPLDGWNRASGWDALAYPWTPPSPNIPDASTALAYVGMCLLEGVNLNEGRGTETPFKIFGAPWLDPEKVLRKLDDDAREGAALEVVAYTPRSIAGKSAKPVHMDAECRGFRLAIRDAEAFRPFRLACALLRAVHEVHGEQLTWNPHFDVLAGGPGLRKVLTGNGKLDRYLADLNTAHRAYAAARPCLYG